MLRGGRREARGRAGALLTVGLTVGLGAGLVAAVAAAQLAYLLPPAPSDPANYAAAARAFPDPPAEAYIPAHHYLRTGLVVPMRLAMAVVGYSQAGYYAVPLLSTALLVAATFAVGRLLVSRTVGAVAAVLVVVNTIVFPEAAKPLPDLTATALFCAAAALAAGIRTGAPPVAGGPRRRLAALVAIGALLGWSALTREYAVVLWPVIGVLLWRRVRPREIAALAAPVVLLVAGDLAFAAIAHGDPLARLSATATHGQVTARPDLDPTFKNLPRQAYLTLFWTTVGRSHDGPWLQAAIVLAAVGALARPRRLGIFALWALAVWVPLVLLGGLLDPGAPRLRLTLLRYWIPLLPAVLIAAAATVQYAAGALLARLARRVPDRVRRRAPRRTRAALTAGAVVAAAVWPVADSTASWRPSADYRAGGAVHLEEFRGWLRAEGGGVRAVWTDPRTAMVLPLFYAEPFGTPVWRGPTRRLGPGGAGPAPGDAVVVYPACRDCAGAGRAVLGPDLRPPPGWERAFTARAGGLVVYRVGG